jgi:hypothetical protein
LFFSSIENNRQLKVIMYIERHVNFLTPFANWPWQGYETRVLCFLRCKRVPLDQVTEDSPIFYPFNDIDNENKNQFSNPQIVFRSVRLSITSLTEDRRFESLQYQ